MTGFSFNLAALILTALTLPAAEQARIVYEPTRESLSKHTVPEWYQDAKIGFFYHWGPQSVVGEKFDKDALLFCRAQGKYAGMHAKNPPGQ
jgi:alpha-L-fucosidase